MVYGKQLVMNLAFTPPAPDSIYRPDHCDGTFDQYCDDSRAYRNITAILRSFKADTLLDQMGLYWKDFRGHDSSLWWHEWAKHGTCISTLEPTCYHDYTLQEEVVDYFRSAVTVFQQRPSYKWLHDAGIVPSTSDTYAFYDIQSALVVQHGAPVTLRCRNGQLNEIWYHFDVKGSVQTGTFVATHPDGTKSSCPMHGIRYLPKSMPDEPTTSFFTSTAMPTPTSTQAPFPGKGFLNVQVDSGQQGCIISDGSWYTSGSCATFIAERSQGGFTLMSRKGKCAMTGGTVGLRCQASIRDATVFGTDADSSLTLDGNATFFATRVPHGFHKGRIHPLPGHDGDISLQLSWQAR